MRRSGTFPLLLALSLAALAGGDPERGRVLYETGTRADGTVPSAYVGAAGVDVPASALPCAGCHGADGHGVHEGGLTPSNITWSALTRPYAVTHISGRRRPPYTVPLIGRAVTRGIDAGDTRLDAAMPRYAFSDADVADMAAWLRAMEHRLDPGLEPDVLHLGVVLGPGKPVVRTVLDAWAARLNARGGLYGRAVQWHYAWATDAGGSALQAARTLIEDEHVFALVACYAFGAEEAMADLAAASATPLIGMFGLDAAPGALPHRQVFYLAPGLRELNAALAAHAVRADGRRASAVVAPPTLAGAAADVADVLARAGLTPRTHVFQPGSDPSVLAARLRADGVAHVYFLGLGDGTADDHFFQAAAAEDWKPLLLVPGTVPLPTLSAWRETCRIVLALPDQGTPDAAGLQTYRDLARDTVLPERPSPAQAAALSAVSLLTEGLTQSGRALTREKLITALEGLYDHATGFGPPVTFGPNRRMGARGVYLLTYQHDRGGWLPLGPLFDPYRGE